MVKIGNRMHLVRYEAIPDGFTGHVVDMNGTTWWFKDGKLHREDGPAVIQANGYKAWYKEELRHREGGPAVIHPNGLKLFYENGIWKGEIPP